MKALFEINNLFKSIINIDDDRSRYYFAIMENRLVPMHGGHVCFPKTKTMVFELDRYDSINILDKLEYMPVYRFLRFED